MYRKVQKLGGSLQSALVLVADIGVLRVRGGPIKVTYSVFCTRWGLCTAQWYFILFCVMFMFLEVFGNYYGAHFLLFFFLLTKHVI